MKSQWVFTIALLGTLGAAAQEDGKSPIKEKIESYTLRPAQREPSDERIKQLKLAPGFQINVFAKDLGNSRMMAVAPDGTVFVARREQGEVSALRDTNNDGVADINEVVFKDIDDVHGVTVHDGYLYLVAIKELYRAPLQNGRPGKLETLIDDIPDGGQHPNRTIAFGPDGALYLSVGSTCNACIEPNPEHATMLRVDPKDWSRKVYAKGLRNTIGFDWHPQTKAFWGWDHGSDELGNDIPPEELNLIKQGGDYGWPFCYGKQVIDPKMKDPKEGTKGEHCAQTIGSTLEYQAHSAPMAFTFYTGSQFPLEYQNNGFVAMRGSWNRKPATGYKIVRVKFQDGKPAGTEDFVSGFLIENGAAHFGRLSGIAMAQDGSLLFSDDANGVVYRVSYMGAGAEQN
ncbi:MAG: sorbosone dehydrogenase family protein [Verrucomicrobia bacterium]|nr:sorbosone dehydrogenase family protein [Verrucomicrobiota bacterium]